MKKIISYAILVVLLMIPVMVKAEDNSLTVSCPSSAKPGQTGLHCTVTASSSSEYSGVSFQISTTQGATVTNASAKGNWNGQVAVDAATLQVSDGVVPASQSSEVLDIELSISESAEIGSTEKVTLSGSKISLGTGTSDAVDVEDSEAEITISEDASEDDPSGGGSSSSSSSDSSGGETVEEQTTTTQDNPKTMDANVALISGILVVGLAAVYVGKKKLNKIGR